MIGSYSTSTHSSVDDDGVLRPFQHYLRHIKMGDNERFCAMKGHRVMSLK